MKDVSRLLYGDLRDYLESEHLTSKLDDESKRELFTLAWEYGHSNGNSEVENYYIDLSTLIDNIGSRK